MSSRVTMVILSALAFAVLAIGLSGNFANPPKFDWSVAVDTGTAVGTTLLALATVWLALEARAEREHTRKLVDIQEQDEVRKDQAWVFVRSALVYFPNGQADPNGAVAEVEIVNAGHGPAVEITAALSVWGDRKPGSGKSNIGVVTLPLVMPMSPAKMTIMPTPGGRFIFEKDVSDFTCIDVQYRDKLTMEGAFREAEPFWKLTPGHQEDFYGAKRLAPGLPTMTQAERASREGQG